MSKKKQQRAASPPGQRPTWLLPGIVIVVLAVIAAIVAAVANSNQTPYVAEVEGAPRAQIEQTTIDHGPQPFERPVESQFRVRNVGDQPLMIASNPQVETIEGC
ncbi:MAG: hypothetical protein IT320_05540 [Anaerolineae bacterium]|nr:hypothetical protein [Anaerolineae bacterium]